MHGSRNVVPKPVNPWVFKTQSITVKQLYQTKLLHSETYIRWYVHSSEQWKEWIQFYVLRHDFHVLFFFLYCYVDVPMGNPMGTCDAMGMDLDTKLHPSWVMCFLASKFYIHGHGFGLTKSSGFIPVAISSSAPMFKVSTFSIGLS
jgi:hypothetical protein